MTMSKPTPRVSPFMFVLGLVPALALACGEAGRPVEADTGIDDEVGDGDSSDGATEDTVGESSDTVSFDMPTEATIVELIIEPANPVIEVIDGVIPSEIDFVGYAVKEGGEQVQLGNGDGAWTFDRLDIAALNPNIGGLTATGLLGGVGSMSFQYEGLEASTSVTVKLKYVVEPTPIDPVTKANLDSAITPDPTLALLYPYDQTVFPRGLIGPTVQWSGGNDPDIYNLHVESSTFELDYYGTVPNPSRWDFPVLTDDLWLKLTDSVEGQVSMQIKRFDGATAYASSIQYWTIAPANLAGTIYYWAVNQGDVLRIQPGASAPETFLQKPPGATCLACHSVSRDGSTIVATQHGGYSPWATFNADGTNIFASDSASGFQAISPDGQWILWGQSGGLTSLNLSPKTSIDVLAQLLEPAGYPSHPAWSPDGTKIAYGLRTDGNWLDFNNSTLWIVDVDVAIPAFFNQHQIVGNDVNRPTVTYPTFSPDSQWIAFNRSTQARTRGAASELWMVKSDGSQPTRLDRADGVGHIVTEQTSLAYEPTFMPVASGGYFWIVFVSERQYGNILTNQDPATRTKQLWVTAIDPNPGPGVDPSHPGFWLPGQELNNNNMRGNAALNECKEIGDTCEAGYDCCSGFCIEDPEMPGVYVCDDDVPMCSPNGSACETDGDCCDDEAQCIGGFCSPVIG
jgi:hypothetical protein